MGSARGTWGERLHKGATFNSTHFTLLTSFSSRSEGKKRRRRRKSERKSLSPYHFLCIRASECMWRKRARESLATSVFHLLMKLELRGVDNGTLCTRPYVHLQLSLFPQLKGNFLRIFFFFREKKKDEDERKHTHRRCWARAKKHIHISRQLRSSFETTSGGKSGVARPRLFNTRLALFRRNIFLFFFCFARNMNWKVFFPRRFFFLPLCVHWNSLSRWDRRRCWAELRRFSVNIIKQSETGGKVAT